MAIIWCPPAGYEGRPSRRSGEITASDAAGQPVEIGPHPARRRVHQADDSPPRLGTTTVLPSGAGLASTRFFAGADGGRSRRRAFKSSTEMVLEPALATSGAVAVCRMSIETAAVDLDICCDGLFSALITDTNPRLALVPEFTTYTSLARGTGASPPPGFRPHRQGLAGSSRTFTTSKHRDGVTWRRW